MKKDFQAAIALGELWRAKQILAGRIGASTGYEPSLFEEYGRVLLLMNDLVLAGKYLFLSGKREPEYEPAIALYLQQHGRAGWKSLIGSFPNAAKRLPLDQFPEPMRSELASLGLPADPTKRQVVHATAQAPTSWKAQLAPAGCLLLAAFIIAALIAGVPVIVRALASLLRGGA